MLSAKEAKKLGLKIDKEKKSKFKNSIERSLDFIEEIITVDILNSIKTEGSQWSLSYDFGEEREDNITYHAPLVWIGDRQYANFTEWELNFHTLVQTLENLGYYVKVDLCNYNYFRGQYLDQGINITISL